MTFWAQKHRPGWWKNAVLYQIYPKSFQDANGDGIGDLPGITARLDYLQTLGVDALWLSPIFASPQVDNGYDISDYRAVDPMFGTLDDLRALIRAADARGIGIVLDLVLNHTSDQHRWFQEAKKSKDNPCHDYYIWRDGTPDAPPNGMKATFGGPAWTWVPELGQYYFHQFAPQQPDLNWENPAVRRALYDMINFWIAEGVAGFRLDVIDQIAKEPDNGITANGPRLMEFLRELNRETFGGKDLVTVGEAWGADLARARQYSAPDGSVFSMVFQFEQMVLDQDGSKWKARPWALPELKASIAKWQQGLHGAGWNSLFWNNHDLPRIVSRWGDDGAYREVSAKMLATLLYGLQGTPYIYQGEELGMTNAGFNQIDQYKDVESLNHFRILVEKGVPESAAYEILKIHSRDNSRTPMQWDGGKYAGFSDAEPWISVNPNHVRINAEAQLQDEDSIFHYYQKLIRLRKDYDVIVYGDLEPLDAKHPSVMAYRRTWENQELLMIANFYGKETAWDAGCDLEGYTRLAGSYADTSLVGTEVKLRPYEAAVLYKEN